MVNIAKKNRHHFGKSKRITLVGLRAVVVDLGKFVHFDEERPQSQRWHTAFAAFAHSRIALVVGGAHVVAGFASRHA